MNDVTINSESRISRNPDIIHTDMDGETVMMSIEQGEYYGLDKVATQVWDLLESEMSVSEICDKLCEKYEVEAEQCMADTLPFLNDMAEHKVINVN